MNDYVRIPKATLRTIVYLASNMEDATDDEIAAMRVGFLLLDEPVAPSVSGSEDDDRKVRWP